MNIVIWEWIQCGNHSLDNSYSTMTNNCESLDLKAEAIIETIPKSCKVNENSIVKYIVTQQPATDTNLTEILKKFDTFAPYKTKVSDMNTLVDSL